ncbi:exosome non-catalytic core subunit rrp46 [Neophaeococcomyces mojaviensis]|uniref:Exosome non-catalytic core subunit rrp46 n=1 Tax=Neophaeococcomyces mojaviensis TaxID=3383035 RepID=A0ACC3ADA0_9EURO|nr:exosome non-catalytic core subunit rrp46 [Knufia sp. JES_112]
MSSPKSKIQLHPLISSNGSALYTPPSASSTLLAGINYPLEVSYRSNEIPEDTYIEVSLRPNNAVGMVKERHIESLVKKVLQSVILGQETPRRMLQCTIQITDAEIDESLPGGVKGGGQGESYLETLASAINVAVLGCLDAGVQMRGIAGSVVVSISRDGKLKTWPGLKQRKEARSLHVFVYGREGQNLLFESEGDFEVEEWDAAESAARTVVVGKVQDGEDVVMEEDQETLFASIRQAVEERVERDGRQKG